VKHAGVTVEVATFRTDGVYADSRHPTSVSFTQSVVDDLTRRDFTMNALIMDGKSASSPMSGTAAI
jgi:tRNA nucleotidyltransferase (CCA-adding enzyme)